METGGVGWAHAERGYKCRHLSSLVTADPLFLVFMGLQKIPVYRLSERKIGCSLAESAEREAYAAFLHQVGGCHPCI